MSEPSIKTAHGNLLQADVEALVNTVNCVGIMGKGIALQFKQAFPKNYEFYERECKAERVRLGEVLVFDTGVMINPRYIINFPTKGHWRSKSKLSDVKSGLVSLVAAVRRHGIKSIAIPPLGCGNGGLSWRDVEPLIRQAFTPLTDVNVSIFPPEGAPAAESMKVATERPNMTRGRALLIKLLSLYREQGYRHSLLEVQKLCYLLQSAGEPLRLNYTKYHYGPYAEALHHVLQRLEGHYLRGYGDRSGDAEIHLLDGAEDEANHFLEGAPDARERLSHVAQLIDGFETPFGMELLASVHWVAKEDPDAARDPRRAKDRLSAWNDRKKRLFKEGQVRVAWERLQSEGWIQTGERL